jgi:hypothetical protein
MLDQAKKIKVTYSFVLILKLLLTDETDDRGSLANESS